MKYLQSILGLMIISCVALSLSGISLAQDMEPVEPMALSSSPVTLDFSTSAAGPPTVEILTDGRMTFRINVAGGISGAFEGTMSALVSEVTVNPSPPYHPISVMFTLETEDGVMEGYYAGSFYIADGSDQADVHAYGKILSVSGAYADLYLADVYVSSMVQFEDGRAVEERGIMTIGS